MTLLKIDPSYSFRDRFKDLNDNDKEEALKILPECRRADGDHSFYGDFIVTGEEAEKLTSLGLTFTVKRFKGETPPNFWGMQAQQAQAVHVHLPNFDLVGFDEVTYLEDACTRELQKHLDEGWRMICVCPPLSERRPTYILGRKTR